MHAATSKVENLAQGLSCQLKFVHARAFIQQIGLWNLPKWSTFSIEARVEMKEQHALKIVNNNLNTNIYSYLETSGGQSYNLNKN
jgi:hypothetical protein